MESYEELELEIVLVCRARPQFDQYHLRWVSVAIPACHFVVTDRRQCDRIKRRGIDKEWGTEVYSMSDIDGLFERLETLR